MELYNFSSRERRWNDMIGLIDLDLQLSQSEKLHPPNLEIMKLATYYKVEEQKFCHLIDLKETELSGYDKIYIFSEVCNLSDVPAHFLNASNIILGGSGLTNGQYIPFENELIDFTLPRPTIYKEFLKIKYQEGVKAKTISRTLDDTYYRYIAGANKLPLPPILPRKRLWVYDREFFQDGWQDWVQEATERKASGIWTIHPIICRRMSDYIAVRKEQKVVRSNTIILDLSIPLNEIPYLLKEYTNFFLEDIAESTNVYLPVGGTLATSLLYYKDLICKLNILYSFWAKSIPIKLKYIPPKLGTTCTIENLLKIIEDWSASSRKDKTIDEKMSHNQRHYKPAAEEKQRLLKFHKNAADLFKQSYQDLAIRRVWRI